MVNGGLEKVSGRVGMRGVAEWGVFNLKRWALRQGAGAGFCPRARVCVSDLGFGSLGSLPALGCGKQRSGEAERTRRRKTLLKPMRNVKNNVHLNMHVQMYLLKTRCI